MRLTVSDTSDRIFRVGDRLLVELSGHPVDVELVDVGHGQSTTFLGFDVDVPVGTSVRIGRHKTLGPDHGRMTPMPGWMGRRQA